MTRVRTRTSDDSRDEETRIARGARSISRINNTRRFHAATTRIFGAATAAAVETVAWEGRRLVRRKMTQATWADLTANLLWTTRGAAINFEPPQTRRQYVSLVDHARGSAAGCY